MKCHRRGLAPRFGVVQHLPDGSPGDDDPFDPTPDQPTDDEEPPCAVYGEDRKCLVYETSLVETKTFDVPDDLDFFEWTESSGDAEDDSTDGWRRVLCAHSHPTFHNNIEINAGIAVGFFGSLRYAPGKKIADNESMVGYLKMICTPWIRGQLDLSSTYGIGL